MVTNFGAYLKSAREGKNLTQREIADRLKVSQSQIGNWELGIRFPSEKQLEALSRAYEIPKDELTKRWIEVKAGRAIQSVGIDKSYSFDIKKLPQAAELRTAEEKLSEVLGAVRSMLGEKKESDFVQIPILGIAPAGDIIDVQQGDEDVIALPRSAVIHAHEIFALRADGVSMEEAGINTGDICVFDADARPDDGDIVLAATPDGITMKYFFKKKDHVELRPASKTFKKVYKLREVNIQGRLVYHIKKY